MSVATAIATDRITRHFGDRIAVDGVSLEVSRGAAFGLLGPNGAGKTTTVRLLAGVLRPTAGAIRLFGEPLTAASSDQLRSRIGVQTDTNLYETLTLRDNLTTWAELYDVPRAEVSGRIDDVVQLLGLADRLGSKVGTLSKGMRQKAALARAVLHRPELLFLDEPTAGLDPESTQELLAYLRGLITSGASTVFICTHQLHGLESLCDAIGILQAGRLTTSGAVDDLLAARWPSPRYRLLVAGSPAAALPHLPANARVAGDGIEFDLAPGEQVEPLITTIATAGIGVSELTRLRPTISDLYFDTIEEHA